MAASALMMQANLLQQQQASVSAALQFPSYFALSPLFSSFLPPTSLLSGFPTSTFLANSCSSSSSSLSAFPAESKNSRLVVLCSYLEDIDCKSAVIFSDPY